MFDEAGTYVVYDGDCPFCSEYVKLLRLREAVGKVEPVNARDDHPAARYATAKGVDLNQEMALILRGEVFSGPDCMHRLALMSTGAGAFNAVMAKVFASPQLSRALYPILRAGRNLTLRLMRRTPITI